MPRVFCDNNDCIHNDDLICGNDEISLQAVGDDLDLACQGYEEETPKDGE